MKNNLKENKAQQERQKKFEITCDKIKSEIWIEDNLIQNLNKHKNEQNCEENLIKTKLNMRMSGRLNMNEIGLPEEVRVKLTQLELCLVPVDSSHCTLNANRTP